MTGPVSSSTLWAKKAEPGDWGVASVLSMIPSTFAVICPWGRIRSSGVPNSPWNGSTEAAKIESVTSPATSTFM